MHSGDGSTERLAPIRVVEVGPRDGLQNEARSVPTDAKIRFIDALSETGLEEIEVSSFVSPKWVPQLADAAEVFAGIRRAKGVAYSALVPNRQGLEGAIAARADKVAVFTAASETFSLRNTNATIAESLEWFGLFLGAIPWGRRLAAGIGGAFVAHQARWVAALTLAFAVVGITQVGPELVSQARGAAPSEPTAAALDQATRWLREHTPDSAVIQATFESRVHVALQRRAVPLPLSTDPEVYREIDRVYKPTYVVVVDSTEFPYYRATDPERFAVLRAALGSEPAVVHAFPGGWIYALR